MRGSLGYTFSIDHWALGVILYELVIGALPFANDEEESLKARARVAAVGRGAGLLGASDTVVGGALSLSL